MRTSRASFINFLVIFVLGFCVFCYLSILRFARRNSCENAENSGELMLNGFKMADLKLGQNLPIFPPFPLQEPPDDRKTLQFPMFTFTKSRGAGQMLFELASLFGLARTLGRVPILNPVTDGAIVNRWNWEIRPDFPKFAEKFEEKRVQATDIFSLNFNIRHCCRYENPETLKKSLIQQHVLLNGVYFQSYKYFDKFRDEIRELLAPKTMNSIRAEAIIPSEHRRNFIVCTHTKQPQSSGSALSAPSDPVFTRAATDFLVAKYQTLGKPVTVAVLGNDPLWAKDVFFDKIGGSKVFSAPKNVLPSISTLNYTAILTLGLKTGDDLAFSRHFCDAVLLSAPTSVFGWWTAYLARETADVYCRDPAEVKDQIYLEMRERDFYPESWQKLKSSDIFLN